jgi:hypothetical protein
MVLISSKIDSGNITHVASERGSEGVAEQVRLRVRDDPYSTFEQKTFKQVSE